MHISAYLFNFSAYALGQVSPPAPQAHNGSPGDPQPGPRSLSIKPRRKYPWHDSDYAARPAPSGVPVLNRKHAVEQAYSTW
jgi:hypothetical protein